MPEAEAGEGEVAHAYGTAAGGGCGNSVVREAVGGSGRGEGRGGPELLGAAGPAGRESPRPFNVPGRPSGALELVSLRPGRLSLRPRLVSAGRRAGSRPQPLEELGGAGGGQRCLDCTQGRGEVTWGFTAQCHS